MYVLSSFLILIPTVICLMYIILMCFRKRWIIIVHVCLNSVNDIVLDLIPYSTFSPRLCFQALSMWLCVPLIYFFSPLSINFPCVLGSLRLCAIPLFYLAFLAVASYWFYWCGIVRCLQGKWCLQGKSLFLAVFQSSLSSLWDF